jgi:hypothetical protein
VEIKQKYAPYVTDREASTWFKIRNPHYSQWAGREKLFERERSLGITEKSLEEALKLLPQLGAGERLNFPPIDVPHHDLVAEGFKLGIG